MQRTLAIWAVFAASGVVLSLGALSSGLATAWVDPVAKIQAQDEAVYAATSLGMAQGDGFLTPKFLGRYALYKPPLLYWLSAALAKLWSEGNFAVRTPSIMAGAGTVALVFAWVCRDTSLSAALTAAILTISSHMVFVLGRVGMTDALLTFEIVLAAYVLARDQRLVFQASVWTFGIASGAAIMTKGGAGAVPLLVLAAACAIAGDHPNWTRLVQALAVTAAVALPWHLWQLWRHPHWFWAEYILTEHLAWGFGAPPQTTQESQVLFYLKRLALLDPALVAAAVLGIARIRPRLPLAVIAVVSAAVLVFQYRNAAYLMPMFPVLAVAAAFAIPPKLARFTVAMAVALFAAKALAPAQPWGIPFAPESVNPSHAALDSYAKLGRPNDLILADPDDQFYSATLRLPHVRYLYLDPSTQRRKFPLDFEYLGITVTAGDFARLNERTPVFRQHLQEFDLDSPAPIATVILARNEDEVAATLADHPEVDFYIPERWASGDRGAHATRPAAPGRVFLLSRVVIQRP